MSTKRIIQIEFDDSGYAVRESELSCPHLAWDEMLGTVAELTHQKLGSARYSMRTDAEHDAWDKKYGAKSRAANPEATAMAKAIETAERRGFEWALAVMQWQYGRENTDKRAQGFVLDKLKCLVNIIDAAGLLNLSRGVELGNTSWYIKASDALTCARAAIAAQQAPDNAAATLARAVLDLNAGWNTKEPEHVIADRLDLVRRLAIDVAPSASANAPVIDVEFDEIGEPVPDGHCLSWAETTKAES